jgi:AcrR family transcriptional regulator
MRGVQPTGVARVECEEREAILFAAIDCIVSVGANGLLAAHVADEAGADVATVRSHFHTRSALAEAVLDHLTDRIVRTLNDDLPPDDRLRLHLTSLASIIEERPALFLVLLELELMGSRDGLVRAALSRSRRAWRERLAALFREGATRDALAVELDVEATVDLVIATALGAGLRGSPASRRLTQLEALLLRPAA